MLNSLKTPTGMSRRHFLGHLTTGALALPASHFFGTLRAHAQQVRNAQKHCILLWMGGGPSHLDTWDPKPESSATGGEFRSIETAAPGVRISEHLPRLATKMKDLSIIRSVKTSEGNHDRGTYLMHTGYTPNPTVVHPSFGSVCSSELGSKAGRDFALPHFVSINRAGESPGFLGMSHAPFAINNPNGRVANLVAPVEDQRMRRRLGFLELVENRFINEGRGNAALGHREVYSKSLKLMNSSYTNAFSLEGEPDSVRDAYGRDRFGAGCLMARRLVQAGVTFVEVGLGGWDNHNNIFSTLRDQRLPVLDRAMSTLLTDLDQRGLLDSTLVVWMGEFGRTPRINANGGRDHWPRSWSVVMGGGGIKGGQVIGATDPEGIEIVDREVGVMDLVATMCSSLGINLDTEFITPLGRPIRVVDEAAAPIAELF